MKIITGAGWMIDMDMGLIMGSWVFDLLSQGQMAVAFAVGFVGVLYLTTMVDEIVFQGSGIHIFEG